MKTIMNRAGSLSLLVAMTAAAALSGASGCGSDQSRPRLFSTDWLDDRGQSIGQVQARLRGAKPAATTDVVVAVAGANADKLVGAPLGSTSTWTFAHSLDARPVIAGSVVVASGGGEVFALDAATGRKLWARPTGGLSLLGAGDDGSVTAVTLAGTAGSTLLVVGRDGVVKRQVETKQQVGDPAVVAGVVFVPWSNQYVSAIDASTGDELGRVVLRDKVSRALTIGGALYFGELAFVRFDERIGAASRGGASRIGLPSRELPGTPRLLVPGNEKQPPLANARDRDRLFARPSAPEGPLSVDSGRFYASYFRLVFGFEATGGKLAWVHTHGSDVLGGEAIAGGLVLCDEQGKISVLDARTGAVSMERSFGEPIKSCVAHADSFRAPAAAGAAPALAEQISAAVVTRDPSLATGQRLLLRELATLPDESATKTLVDIASDSRAAPALVADARAALATRRNGASFMIAALGKRYDFLKDVLVSPPVGPIADALAAMKETRGAPLLAAHLLDPANTDDDVRHAAAALATLATKDELSLLKQFFAMYRGTAELEDVAVAVASVGEALVRLEPKEGRALVEGAVKDPMTSGLVRPRLEALLTAAPGDKADKADKPADKPDSAGKPADKASDKPGAKK